jgi:hypothetical protein
MGVVARRLAWLLIPPTVVAAITTPVAVRLGYPASRGVGVALIGVGLIVAFTMAVAGDEAISGWEMRMDGREPRGLRGTRWVEQAWATGVSDPRSLPQHDSSIDRWLMAGLTYIALGLVILFLF